MSSTDEDEENFNNNNNNKIKKSCDISRKSLEFGKDSPEVLECVPNGHDPGEGCSGYNGRGDRDNVYGLFIRDYYDSSSETEDDQCVYKYKGNGIDTYSSENLQIRERLKARPGSPEADYLEMDFDPGVSIGQDDDSDCCDMGESCESDDRDPHLEDGVVSRSPSPNTAPTPQTPPSVPKVSGNASTSSEMNPPLDLDWKHVDVSTKKLDFMDEDVQFEPGMKARIWSEKEAFEKQIFHNVSSSTGIAAVINTLNSFKITFNEEDILEKLGLPMNLKFVYESLPKYLYLRSTAGRSHLDLIRVIKEISHDQLVCRFFGTYPPRRLDLSAFLFYWIKKGAVPILTFNPNRELNTPNSSVVGIWHHRIVWSVGECEVYLSDPIECMPTCNLYHLLSTQPTLFIDKDDLLSKWKPDEDLTPLMNEKNCVWKHHNVLGQVVNLIREFMSGRGVADGNHVEIPANFQCGITLVITKDSPHVFELVHAPEFPLRNNSGAWSHRCVD